MEIKKLDNFEEPILDNDKLNEATQTDINNLNMIVAAIRKLGMHVGYNYNNFSGEVTIDGRISFTTSGRETFSAVYSYISGIFAGLNYKK